MKMTWCGLKIEENCHVLVNQFHGNYHYKTPSCWKIRSVFRDVKWCFNASWGLKGLSSNHEVFYLFYLLNKSLLLGVKCVLKCQDLHMLYLKWNKWVVFKQWFTILYYLKITLKALNYIIKIITNLKLCLAITSHNFKWVKISYTCTMKKKRHITRTASRKRVG